MLKPNAVSLYFFFAAVVSGFCFAFSWLALLAFIEVIIFCAIKFLIIAA